MKYLVHLKIDKNVDVTIHAWLNIAILAFLAIEKMTADGRFNVVLAIDSWPVD